MFIEWFSCDNLSMGKKIYKLERIVENGLEGKKNFLFFAPYSDEKWPFRWLLAMEPIPSRLDNKSNLISHLHLQFANLDENLVNDMGLVNKKWYATMCDADATIEQKCKIILALHKME